MFFVAVAAFALTAQTARAHEVRASDLIVVHPVAFETTPMSRSGAGYLSITDTGDANDRLIEVRADFPRVSIHKSAETGGIMRMIRKAPKAGDEIPATLVFEGAGEIEVVFNVQKRVADRMDHSDHGGNSDPDGAD